MFKSAMALVVVFAQVAPTNAPTMTVSQILAHMSANTAGLTSYQVPVHIDAHVRSGAISLPVKMDGDRYFKSPDRSALKIRSGVPTVAKSFQNTYASLGTPATWLQTYNVKSQAMEDIDGHHTYALTATYKRQSKVDHIVLDVDTTTFDAVRVQWFYTNGSTLVMHIQESVVGNKYRLPLHEDVDARFPSYRGTASVTYGTYAVNVPIDDSVFASSSN